jgi:hypothetical protein
MTTEAIANTILVAAARDGTRGITDPVEKKHGALAARELLETVVRTMAAEILDTRRLARLDSRRAGQLKRLRQTIELRARDELAKLDNLERVDTPEALIAHEPPWLADAAKALGLTNPDGSPIAMSWTELLAQMKLLRDKLDDADNSAWERSERE